MIEHVSLRCSNSKKSRRFYQSCLEPLGYACDMEYGDSFGFAESGRHDFWVTKGKVGTPTHLAFHAKNTKQVDAFYAAAMEAGGKDNGQPGPRQGYGYAAFVFDPDGHNIEVVIWDEEMKKQAAGFRLQAAGPKPRSRSAKQKRRKAQSAAGSR